MPASERGTVSSHARASPRDRTPTPDSRREPGVTEQRTPAGRTAPPRGPLLLAGLLHAALLGAAFPPLAWWPPALIAPIPLLWVAQRPGVRPARDAFWAALGTLPFWAWAHVWVIPVTTLGYPLLVLQMGAYVWLAMWVAGRAQRRWPRAALSTLPLVWVGVEFFRGHVFWHGYPWFLSGQPLIDAPGMPGLAAIGGVYTVSLLVALLGVMTLDLAAARSGGARAPGAPAGAPRRVARAATGVVLFTAIGAGLGAERAFFRVGNAPLLRIAVVQTNLPQDNKTLSTPAQLLERWEDLCALTAAAAQDATPPDLIAWPETILPGFLNAEALATLREAQIAWNIADGPYAGQQLPVTYFADQVGAVQELAGVPLLIGAEAAGGVRVERPEGGVRIRTDAQYNSAFLVRDGRVDHGRYDKIHLTPFGEVMPYISNWPWLERLMLGLGARGMSFDLASGRTPFVFEVQTRQGRPVRIATPICFEATSPAVCRRLAFSDGGRRADVLVNLTNDGWFSWFDAGRQTHLLLARWRAAELATPVVRVANTGISCIIDASGRVVRRGVPAGDARAQGVLVAGVPPPGGTTPYARTGDAPGWASLAAATILFLGSFVPRKRRAAAPESPMTASPSGGAR